MTHNTTVRVYRPEEQGSGSFDGGRITETKPIGFQGDGSAVDRIGPLFYWAWASATSPAKIGLHPHKGFEICSYVIEGELGHFDTQGNTSRVAAGGLQGMLTGSGISHSEEMFGERTEFFQIWFEPDLSETLKDAPSYLEFAESDLPQRTVDGVGIRSIVGAASPARLRTDVVVERWTLPPGSAYEQTVSPGRIMAAVVISGTARFTRDEQPVAAQRKDFVVAPEGPLLVEAAKDHLDLMVVDVLADVPYPLLPK